MGLRATNAHPVKTLREQATALEAALTVCMAKPVPKAVHRLRTTTRRIEAQLLLLDQLKGLPRHRREQEKIQKRLKKLRRFAGEVRDLDVQIKQIAAYFTTKTAADVKDLQERLRRQRDKKAVALVDLLKQRSAKISVALERLLAALEPAEGIDLPATELVDLARGWFAGKAERASTEEELHAVRKAAKLVRYMAEGAPDSVRAKKFAKEFEDLQQAGGEWHDWLQLAGVANVQLEEGHVLVKAFEENRDKSLRGYRARLAKLDR